MKILLQHVRTQLFVRSLGNWTANPLEAYDFQHSQRAIDFARDHGLTAVQIAVKFVDAQFDEVFPLPAATAATPQPVRA
jgi:aryl-alcohol dehydrogenase-like predicted oxidoreductase